MTDLQDTETSQDFTDFVEHVSRHVRRRDGLLIGSIAELPLEYITTRMDNFCVDSLQFCRDQCAVLAGETPPRNFKGTVFLVEPTYARPGYARLRKTDCGVGSRRRTRYFSVEEMSTYSCSKGPNSYREDVMLDFLGVENDRKQRRSSGLSIFGMNLMKLSIQGAVTCVSWPQEAADWKTRKRAHHWPAKDLLENVVNSGCHLVPFKSASFSNDSTVFRYSFARAEVALIYTWTPVQKYIYHVLRLIKSDIVRQFELQGHANIVNAYHFKTLMLWACETKPPSFWDENRMKSSVGELLCQIVEFLVDRCCPNYFIPSVNLMEHLAEGLDVDAVIMPLLVFKEQGAARLMASVPMASPTNSRSTIRVSNKLMNLGQIGLRSVDSHSGHRGSIARFCEEPPKRTMTYPAEFDSLFKGVSAHLRLARHSHCGGYATVIKPLESDYETAVTSFEQAMLAEISTFTSSQVSLTDALPEMFSNIFYPDESNPETSSKRSDNPSSVNGDTACYNTIATTQSDLSKHHASCKDRKMAKEGTENDSKKVYSELSEQSLEKSQQQGSAERKPVQSNAQLALSLTINLFIPSFELMFPKASSFISAAYRANFFYSHCHDYQVALQVCDESLRQFDAIKMESAGMFVHDACSVALTQKWMPIFDLHIQVVYGFVALCNSLNTRGRRKSFAGRASECWSSAESDLRDVAPPLYLSPLEFMDYIKLQCEAKLLSYHANTDSQTSQRLFSCRCTIAQRSRFILNAAFRISTECRMAHSYCGRSAAAWNSHSTRHQWYN